MLKRMIMFAAVAGLVLAMTGSANAVTSTYWDNNEGTMKWNGTDKNWIEGTTHTAWPGHSDKRPFFTSSSAAGTVTIDSGDVSVTWMQFQVPGYVIASSGGWGINVVGGSGWIACLNADATISAPIKSGNWQKMSDNTLILSGTSDHNGWTKVYDGTLKVTGTYTTNDLYFQNSDGSDILDVSGAGVFNVLQSNFSVADADSAIASGNITADGGAGTPQVRTVSIGGTDHTQIYVPEPATMALLLLGLPFVMRRKRR